VVLSERAHRDYKKLSFLGTFFFFMVFFSPAKIGYFGGKTAKKAVF